MTQGLKVTIVYKPKNVLKKLAPKKQVEKLVSGNLNVNRAAINAVARASDFIVGKSQLEKIAVKVVNQYKKKEKKERKAGSSKRDAIKDALNDKKLLIQRVNNAVTAEITETIKSQYRGEFYEWLPSSAAEPDEKHMEKYGEVFQLGVGEAPGDRFGCQCGMKILVDSNKLKLQD